MRPSGLSRITWPNTELGKLSQRFTDRTIGQLRRRFGISHGSVAKHLRCGWIFSDSIITNFLLILTVK